MRDDAGILHWRDPADPLRRWHRAEPGTVLSGGQVIFNALEVEEQEAAVRSYYERKAAEEAQAKSRHARREEGAPLYLLERHTSSAQLGTYAARVQERDDAKEELGSFERVIPSTKRTRTLGWLDTETTGLGAGAQVIAVALLLSDEDGSNPREPYMTLVRLEAWATVDASALRINGLNPRSIEHKRAPLLRDVLQALAPRLEGVTIAGHNVGFDTRFLRSHYERESLEIPAALQAKAPSVDTQSLAKDLHKRGLLALPPSATSKKGGPSTSLDTLKSVFGIVGKHGAHTAHGDVGNTLRVYRELRRIDTRAALPLAAGG